jgi:catechol 2,3-dioxygenase-like lactoylglutathione lyase family enzyme
VSNIKESRTWYTEKLGFKDIYEDLNQKLVVLDTFSPTSLTIWETNEEIKTNPGTTTFPIFKSIDAKETHAELQKRNVKVGDLTTDSVVTYFTFHDPDNNVLEVCQVHD